MRWKMFNDADLNQLNHFHNQFYFCRFFFVVFVVVCVLVNSCSCLKIVQIFVWSFLLAVAIDTINCD